MDRLKLSFAFAVAALLSVAGVRAAEHEGHGEPGDKAPKQESADKDVIEKQKPAYPLKTCVISGEKLDGDMGAAVDYVHQGRLVKFCCAGCVKKFTKDPDTFLKKIDGAAKIAKPASADAQSAPKKEAPQPKREEGSKGNSGAGHGCCGK